MRVKFLLGPAGRGKTFDCLAAVRAALRADPAGAPLIFLAPKQATFQIERQILADPDIAGYTRLNIFSFDRLARFALAELGVAPPEILSTEGRVMVLRALLTRHEEELKLFRRSALRPGFALELSAVLAELQQHQFTAASLRTLAGGKSLRVELRSKLLDLALLLDKYELWLSEHGLQDANHLLEFAAAALRQVNSKDTRLKIAGFWLDGFAEMTPQELEFLTTIIPFCEQATLAFCLETDAAAVAGSSRLSIWSAIGKTFNDCLARVEKLPGCQTEIEILPRGSDRSRFRTNPSLDRLETTWARQSGFASVTVPEQVAGVRIVECGNPEAEALLIAREIRKFVRRGNRYRDCAVLFRNLEPSHALITRAFRRHQIPFFLDRRESVSHHPLTELTRSALRLVAYDWQHDDWFAALKAGFCPVEETEIDRLENQALESGWRGIRWLEPLADASAERLRLKLLPPFENFRAGFSKINFQLTGPQLASLFRELWSDLDVPKTLEQWTREEQKSAATHRPPAIHATVWDQMNAWLDNLALAFPNDAGRVADWLPILDAGLAGLTVGVIPPVLDEVLVGAIDRARNPNLKLAVVAGVNEGVFPATPPSPPILTNYDREELADQKITLGLDVLQQISREHYLGYIACTRASEELLVTYARQDSRGKTRNASPFITHLQKILPPLDVEEFSGEGDWMQAESAGELIAPLAAQRPGGSLPGNPNYPSPFSGTTTNEWPGAASLNALVENLMCLREPDPKEMLSAEMAGKVYGPILRSSVSRLEEFAQCPFRFFVHSGLRAGERKKFELDSRERGSFQHEVLKIFYDRALAENRSWRDLTPDEARLRVGEIAAELAPKYRDGMLQRDAQSRFDARVLTLALQEFIGTLIGWMRGQYLFDPIRAEWEFGLKEESPAPAWKIGLPNGHALALGGKIDRIDLYRDDARSLAVVMDYKSSQKKLDPLLVRHGIQLQLLAYLAAVRSWPADILGAGQITPTGVFYVNLRGQFAGGSSRSEALEDPDESRRAAYRHTGRFDAEALDKLDAKNLADQFNYRRNKDGSLRKGLVEALPQPEIIAQLDEVESRLKEIGTRILSGSAEVDPYRKGGATACDYCDYAAICRIDKWTHSWRVLRAENAAGPESV
jgi:ATP-dependent helicase/nuclease subunit B